MSQANIEVDFHKLQTTGQREAAVKINGGVECRLWLNTTQLRPAEVQAVLSQASTQIGTGNYVAVLEHLAVRHIIEKMASL